MTDAMITYEITAGIFVFLTAILFGAKFVLIPADLSGNLLSKTE